MSDLSLGMAGLRAAIDRLRASGDDIGAAQLAVAEAAYWVAALDDVARAACAGGSTAYYAARRANSRGRVVAGLIFARNLTTHQLVGTYGLTWKPAAVRVMQDGAWKEAKMKVRTEGGWVEATPKVARGTWKDRAELPAPDWPEKHGREGDYDTAVAGKDAVTVLQDALSFFTDLNA